MLWYGDAIPMTMTDPLLSVVMPAHNERTTWKAGFNVLWVLLKYRFLE